MYDDNIGEIDVQSPNVSHASNFSNVLDGSNDIDMKYELFCKWLQQNNYNTIPVDSFQSLNTSTSGVILTEDEVSSFATNTDIDSDSDEFLDTESEFPAIILTNSEIQRNLDHNQLSVEQSINELRAETPSDYDCGASDTTINSGISATSDQSKKRKAKHNKGRAPPIPNLSNNLDGLPPTNGELFPIPNIVRETDI